MLRRLLLLLLVATPAVAGSRVTASLDGPSPPAALLSSLEALAAACERGDRRALIDLISPEHRAEVQALADTLLSSTTTPLTDVRIELVRWDEPQATGSLLLTARAPIRRAGGATTIAPLDGFVPATPGSAGRSLAFERFPSGLLALRDGHGAGVRHLDAELRLEPKPPRILGRVTEDLDGEPVVAFLEMASGTFVRSLSQDVRVTPLDQVLGRPSSSAVRVEWLPGGRRGRVEFESVALLDRNSVQGEIIALLHQSQAIPFATTGHFTADVILDAPLPSRPVSVGTEEELPAEPGRRRVRFRTGRPVDYLPIAAGPYQVSTLGEGSERLELWRTRQVGGDANAILAELRELVRFQEEAIAPLPYRAFRLVELPNVEGLAVSYASLIFMGPGLLATRELREEILAHEVGHQWWGNAVSPHPTARWAAEGMADAMKDLHVLRRHGQERMLDRQDEHRRALVGMHGAASRPLGSSPGGGDAYHRGALFVHALRAETGDDLFWRILRRWYVRLAGTTPRTADFRREAEAEAGRSLASVFEPWLGTTALPIVESEIGVEGRLVRVTLRQPEPHFTLDVPLRAMGAGGEVETWTQRLAGEGTSADRELPFEPVSVDVDPGELLPRVLDDERPKWLLAEAASCLARGETRRARRLLELESARSLLPRTAAMHLFAARVLDGMPSSEARSDLDVVLAELPNPEQRQDALLAAADDLLRLGAAQAALPLLESLDAEIPSGSAVPHRLGLALRALGRETEARVAFERALARKPDDAAAAAALGREPAPQATPSLATRRPLLPPDDALLRGSAAEGTQALALGADRFAVLLSGARTLLAGKPGAMKKVADFAPSGAIGLTCVDPSAERPLLAILETSRRASRLSFVEVGADGSASVVARHERAPGGARALVADGGGSVLAAWLGENEQLAWHRFVAPLRTGSGGPDDDDGLLRIRPADDARWQPFAVTPPLPPAITGGGALVHEGALATVRDDGARLATATETLWESLGGHETIVSARAFRHGLALILERRDATSPLAADASAERRLLVVAGNLLIETPLDDGALDASVAPDGSVVMEVEAASPEDARLFVDQLIP